MNKFAPTHRHFKGGLYQLLHVARHSDTTEEMAVYCGADGTVWVRPLAMFGGMTVDGGPRFAPLPIAQADAVPNAHLDRMPRSLILIIMAPVLILALIFHMGVSIETPEEFDRWIPIAGLAWPNF
ncbi:MAG: DUF1653 domain-containing protein [Alphaproteobacteria bacterium]|nr:DUF1653 domain-containing protein [Alphaproteobacteria bacterium]